MSGSPQAFWLDALKGATHFNRWIFDSIAPHLGKSVLEIGCGIGNFTSLLAVPGRKVTAVDLEPEFVETAKAAMPPQSSVEFHAGDATTMEWENQFDTILMLDVLEHIEDDLGFLRKLSGSLNEGGRIILKVPA